jgi:hypothetical protein
MSINKSVFVFAVAFLVAACLAACDSSSSAGGHPMATASATSVPVRAVSHPGVLAGAFVRDFRSAYPKLAKGVSNGQLADEAVATCNMVPKLGLKRADALSETSKRFSANGLRPDDVATVNIMKLVVARSCSDRTEALNKLL